MPPISHNRDNTVRAADGVLALLHSPLVVVAQERNEVVVGGLRGNKQVGREYGDDLLLSYDDVFFRYSLISLFEYWSKLRIRLKFW